MRRRTQRGRLRRVHRSRDFADHSRRTASTRDCRQHVNLTLRGWRLLPFSWEVVMFDRNWVVEATRQAMAGPPGHHNEPQSGLLLRDAAAG